MFACLVLCVVKPLNVGFACDKVAVFRVADMSDPKRRFKVDVNAKQRGLTGGVVTCT